MDVKSILYHQCVYLRTSKVRMIKGLFGHNGTHYFILIAQPLIYSTSQWDKEHTGITGKPASSWVIKKNAKYCSMKPILILHEWMCNSYLEYLEMLQALSQAVFRPKTASYEELRKGIQTGFGICKRGKTGSNATKSNWD